MVSECLNSLSVLDINDLILEKAFSLHRFRCVQFFPLML